MADDWTTIGGIAEVFDGPHATPKKIDRGPYFLSISSLDQGKLDLSKSAHISEEQYEKWTKRVTPQEGDVLFSYETRLGEAALMPGGIKACLGRRMGLLRPNRELVDPSYLLFAYLGPDFQREIVARTNSGATVDRIALKELPSFPIRIPQLQEQREVASVLSALDNKIELNRQINTTLESMAQALFKSWFVDFDPVIDNALAAGNPIPEPLQARAEKRAALLAAASAAHTRSATPLQPLPADLRALFPGSFVFNEEMGWVPEGWGISPINLFGDVVCGKTPSKSKPEFYGDDVPFIKIPDMHQDMFVVDPGERLSLEGANSQVKKMLPRGSVCVSCIATVGKVIVTIEPSQTNQQINSIVPRSEHHVPYLYFYMQTLNKRFHDLASGGSATLNMNTSTFSKVSILNPSDGLLEYFYSRVKSEFEKIELNLKQSLTLSRLRDLLLPKLLAGQIQIPEAEKLAAEAV